MSFYTSLSGLKGAQTDLSVISNNVANVGSIGFKKSKAEFGDLISAAPLQSGNLAGQGTRLKSITQQFTQGGFQSSDRALDLAISGQGFFITRGQGAAGQLSFTRNGSFTVDENRAVIDSRGAYLQVLPVDQSGNVTATGISSVRNLEIPLTAGLPRATTTLDLSATFPSDADLPASRDAYSGSIPYAFDRFDPNSYNYSSATTVFDSAGNPQQATIYYVRTTSPTSTNPNTTWDAHLFIGDQPASADGNASTTPAAPLTLTFAPDGSMIAPTAGVQFSAVLPSGASEPIQISLAYGSSTRQAASTFTPGPFRQDGKAAGQLDNVAIDTDGLVTATFTDGTTTKLGKVVLANFSNPNGLRQLGDATWSQTGKSGDANVTEAGNGGTGIIQSGALEQANVDLTEELVALIAAQRNFQANAKAIETANTLTQAIVNLRN